jgi:hypothetical protein
MDAGNVSIHPMQRPTATRRILRVETILIAIGEHADTTIDPQRRSDPTARVS